MFLYSFTVRTLSYSLQKGYAAAVLTVLERFGYDISKLDGKKSSLDVQRHDITSLCA